MEWLIIMDKVFHNSINNSSNNNCKYNNNSSIIIGFSIIKHTLMMFQRIMIIIFRIIIEVYDLINLKGSIEYFFRIFF